MDKNVNYPIKQSVNNHCSDNKSRSIWKMWVSVDRFRQTGQVAQVNLTSEALTNKRTIFKFSPPCTQFFCKGEASLESRSASPNSHIMDASPLWGILINVYKTAQRQVQMRNLTLQLSPKTLPTWKYPQMALASRQSFAAFPAGNCAELHPRP